jgi:replicative DNA helicase
MIDREKREKIVLGTAILNPEVIPQIRKSIPDASYLILEKHREIYLAICNQFESHGTVSLEILGESGFQFQFIGDLTINSSLTEYAGCAYSIYEDHFRGEIESVVANLRAEASESENILETISVAQEKLTSLKHSLTPTSVDSMEKIAGETVDFLDSIFHGQTKSIPFGLIDIDNETGGMDNGDLVVIAGAEKSGKTMLALQTIFLNAKQGVQVLLFSCEMFSSQILTRFALMELRLAWKDVKRNVIGETQKANIFKKISELSTLPIQIRSGVFTIHDIMDDVKRNVETKGTQLVAVDYIQRVVPVNKTGENREREIANISSGLKSLAMQFKLPVIALSQVNEDLRARESRAIEQDMDKMITINNVMPSELTSDTYDVDIRIRQRMGLSGNLGGVKLHWDVTRGCWANGSPYHNDYTPTH